MAKSAVVITLTPSQRALIRQASGKSVLKLGIEPIETGSGWLYSGAGKQWWLLKHPDLASYEAARRAHLPQINCRYAHFRLRIGGSSIHRWGMFAEERIPARRNVIEYIGELVNQVEIYRRNKGIAETYSFKLDQFWRIDGSVGGSGAEFINHSCDPNLRWRVDGDHVLCQSTRVIAAGEELTLDYHFSFQAPKIACHCGSSKCRGTINVLQKRRTKSRNSKARAHWARLGSNLSKEDPQVG